VDTDLGHYEVAIDMGNRNTSHTQVAELIGRGKRVLDVGCWTGDLGRLLLTRGNTVSGLEIDAAAAERAAADFEVVVADLNVAPASEHFEAGSFDVVVFADVLEHLMDPVQVLVDATKLLAPDGKIVISVPNVGHGSVRLALLQGRWNYTATGLLDATHIRFFNRENLLSTFGEAGLVVEDLRGTIADPLDVEVVVDSDRLPPTVVEWVRHQRDALVYQFVAAARLPRDDDPVTAAEVPLVPAAPEESVRRRDKYTQRARLDREERQERLNVRDHIIGLEAATATAQAEVAKIARQLKGAQSRLDRKNARIKELSDELRGREHPVDDRQHGGLRDTLSKLRGGPEQ
jgi:2-polyprenyl-3-methyl-5-hydroxy-6-metoxy-1,4-benzoquinol methylase